VISQCTILTWPSARRPFAVAGRRDRCRPTRQEKGGRPSKRCDSKGAVRLSENRNPYSYLGWEVLRLESIPDFVRAIVSGDPKEINFCLYEARKRSILKPLFQELAVTPSPPLPSKYAFHIALVTQGRWLRETLGDDALLLDVLVNLLPGYSGPPVELFRGEMWSNHETQSYGVSWTTDRSMAEMFARGLNRCPQTGGVLLRTVAPASAILAAPNDHSRYLGELEYIVDRRALTQVEVLERYTPE
jgi:hypothetical protein